MSSTNQVGSTTRWVPLPGEFHYQIFHTASSFFALLPFVFVLDFGFAFALALDFGAAIALDLGFAFGFAFVFALAFGPWVCLCFALVLALPCCSAAPAAAELDSHMDLATYMICLCLVQEQWGALSLVHLVDSTGW